MIKYGIKLKGKLEHNGFYVETNLKSVISEFIGMKSVIPLEFKSIAEAEVYAQNHEFKNYNIEAIYS